MGKGNYRGYLGSFDGMSPGNVFRSIAQVIDFGERKIKGYGVWKDSKGKKHESSTVMRFPLVPSFSYSLTCGLDLVGMLRFFPIREKRKVIVGVERDFFTVKREVEYVGEETVVVPFGEVACYMFEVKGKGILAALFGKKAWIWLSKESPHYMVKYRNENPYGPGFDVLEYRLAYRRPFPVEKWERVKDFGDYLLSAT